MNIFKYLGHVLKTDALVPPYKSCFIVYTENSHHHHVHTDRSSLTQVNREAQLLSYTVVDRISQTAWGEWTSSAKARDIVLLLSSVATVMIIIVIWCSAHTKHYNSTSAGYRKESMMQPPWLLSLASKLPGL